RPPAGALHRCAARANSSCEQHFEIVDVSGCNASFIEQSHELVIGKCLLAINAHVYARQRSVAYLDRDLDHVSQIRNSAARHLDCEMQALASTGATGDLPERNRIRLLGFRYRGLCQAAPLKCPADRGSDRLL